MDNFQESVHKAKLSEDFLRAMRGIAAAQESLVHLFRLEEIERLISPNFNKLYADFDRIIDLYQTKLSSHYHCLGHLSVLVSFWETHVKDPFLQEMAKTSAKPVLVNNNHFRVILFVA